MDLEPLTFLVGPNGAGKSNFVDAIRFITDALQLNLYHSIRERAGLAPLMHRGAARASEFSIGLIVDLPENRIGSYSLTIESTPDLSYEVAR